jgi:hypothetical protein
LAVFSVLVRLVVGLLLLLAGWAKLTSSSRFRQQWLNSYGLIPRPMLPAIAWMLPIAEVAIGCAILVGAFGSVALWSASILLACVTGAVAVTLLRGYQPPCGCMGKVDSRLIDWPLVARNVVLITCSLIAGWVEIPSLGVGALLSWPLQAGLVAAVVVLISYAAARHPPAPAGGMSVT